MIALDVFADSDTKKAAEHVYKIEYANSGFDAIQFEAALDQIDCSDLMGFAYGSGFEAQPNLLARIAERLPLIGNSPDTVRRLKNAPEFFAILDQLNIPHPEVCFKPLVNPNGWLCKEEGGSGGTHVVDAKVDVTMPAGQYYQRLKDGIPISMLFAANGNEVKVVGFNQQWVAPIAEKPYRYGGIVGNANLPSQLKIDLGIVAEQLTQAFGLRGLNSLDVIWQDDAFWVLEINPRLSSTLDLYQSQNANLFELHVQAVAGDLSQFPHIPAHSRARNVLYAANDIVIPKDFIWPAWIADIPMPLTSILKDQPICTVLAEAENATEAQGLVLLRVQTLSNQLFN